MAAAKVNTGFLKIYVFVSKMGRASFPVPLWKYEGKALKGAIWESCI